MICPSMILIWSNFNFSEIAEMIGNLTADAPIVAQDVAKAKAPDWTFSGALDTYYGSSTPKIGVGANRLGRQFDVRNEQLRVATAQATIKYRADQEGFGLTATPFIGDNADILFGYDNSGSLWVKHFAEAYLTYKRKGLTLDLGKFYSWIGWEGVEAWNNDLYSRALLYTIVQPNYHCGLRATYNFNDTNTLAVYATRGWNQTNRNPKGITFGAQYKRIIDKKTTAYLGFITGKEGSLTANNSGGFGGIGFFVPTVADTTLLDLILVRQQSEAWRFTLNASSAKAGGAKFYGASFVARYQVNPKLAVAGRIESVGDDRGVRFGVPAKATAMTLGLDYSLSGDTTLRLDVRADRANVALYPRLTGGPAKTQTTFNVGLTFKF